jgi:hypothetical protein
MTNYLTFLNDDWSFMSLDEVALQLNLPLSLKISQYSNEAEYQRLWSARLSTGVFGLSSCPAGNNGPKENCEIVLSIGNKGLVELINLGFITCPCCHPENTKGFWETVENTVKSKYNIEKSKDFVDKEKLPFDCRNIDYEKILPKIKKTPNRFYLPNGLVNKEVNEFKERIDNLGFGVSSLGFYDNSVGFIEYL